MARLTIPRLTIFGAAAIVAALANPAAMAQEVISNPGYCAQFYPNANCQNKGPRNPYTGDYQHQLESQRYGDGNAAWDNGRNDRRSYKYGTYDNGYNGAGTKAMPSGTDLSARPVPGSRAKTAAGTAASKPTHSATDRKDGLANRDRLFPCPTKRRLRSPQLTGMNADRWCARPVRHQRRRGSCRDTIRSERRSRTTSGNPAGHRRNADRIVRPAPG